MVLPTTKRKLQWLPVASCVPGEMHERFSGNLLRAGVDRSIFLAFIMDSLEYFSSRTSIMVSRGGSVNLDLIMSPLT